MTDHLSPEQLFEFIDEGGGSGPAGWHLMSCPEHLVEDRLLLRRGRYLRQRRIMSSS